jgi:hypothetical protein
MTENTVYLFVAREKYYSLIEKVQLIAVPRDGRRHQWHTAPIG